MADKKISALPAATTPLAGTEVLPIVQGGTTDQVSVADLTAGRAVSALSITMPNTEGAVSYTGSGATIGRGAAFATGQAELFTTGTRPLGIGASGAANLNFYTGSIRAFYIDTNQNLVVQTAGKGIDFSANTHAAGMTSELLNDYEEGTFTPTLSSSGTAPTVTSYNTRYGSYTKIGNRVLVTVAIRATMTVAGTGFPVITGLPYAANASCLNGPAWGLANMLVIGVNANYISGTTVQLASCTYNIANDYLCFSIMYEV
jgi:hypothetical protein